MSAHRTARRVLPVLLVSTLAAAGCNSTSSPKPGAGAPAKAANVKDGGTLTFGADQEPSGFNNNTSKDNSTAAGDVDEGLLPSVFKPTLTSRLSSTRT